MSWHGATMMEEGIRSCVTGIQKAFTEGTEEPDYLELMCNTALTELDHLAAWHTSFGGYPEDAWKPELETLENRIHQLKQEIKA
jgi:hypothetical protein